MAGDAQARLRGLRSRRRGAQVAARHGLAGSPAGARGQPDAQRQNAARHEQQEAWSSELQRPSEHPPFFHPKVTELTLPSTNVCSFKYLSIGCCSLCSARELEFRGEDWQSTNWHIQMS